MYGGEWRISLRIAVVAHVELVVRDSSLSFDSNSDTKFDDNEILELHKKYKARICLAISQPTYLL